MLTALFVGTSGREARRDAAGLPAMVRPLAPGSLPLMRAGPLLMRTHEGRVWFSVNGRSGVEFKNNQGFYEFDLEIK